MKFKYLILSMMAAAFLMSAINFDRTPTPGSKAPKIETIEGINVVTDANSEGKVKIVSFWNPKIPASRIANKELEREVAEKGEMEFISICTDQDQRLMEEVMKLDGVNPESNYSYSQIAPRVFKDYNVEDGYMAFVISPEGKIEKLL